MKSLLAAVALVVLTAGTAHAGGLSNVGDFVCTGCVGGDAPPGLFPSPVTVPEPATLGLLAGGVIMLAAVARSRQKKG